MKKDTKVEGKNALDKKDIAHVAALANIPISDKEAEVLAKDISDTLGAIETLRELPVESLPPTFQTTGLKNVTRLDQVKSSLTQKEALGNARDSYQGYFRVKAIFEKLI